jgi:uncharacterized protein YjbI with pentapeptide repeats
MKPSNRKEIQPPRLAKRLTVQSVRQWKDNGEYAELELSGGLPDRGKILRPAFESVLFRKAVFGPARFAQPCFLDCRFETADLSGGEWEQARFRRVEFSACRGIGAQFPEGQWEDAAFIECNLERSLFDSGKFRSVRFVRCQLAEASFGKADLSGAVFDDCDLSGADMRESILTGTDFRGSKIGGMQAGTRELKGAILESVQVLQIAGLLGVVVREKGE